MFIFYYCYLCFLKNEYLLKYQLYDLDQYSRTMHKAMACFSLCFLYIFLMFRLCFNKDNITKI